MAVHLEMDTNFLVSVITPAYNCQKYIQNCIDSVLRQTYQNWEMIIVDDKSTDHTAEIAQASAAKDSRIKVIKQSKNTGAATARNRAISAASGRFIAFLDADDAWKPNKLEKQIAFMLDHNYAFTFTAYEIHSFLVKGNTKVFHVPHSITYNQYLKNTIIGNLTVILDRQLMGEITIVKGHLEDVLTWMKYLKMGFTAYGLNESLAIYRVTKFSISGNKLRNAKRYYHCLRREQKLNLFQSIWCQAGYLFHAIRKRLF